MVTKVAENRLLDFDWHTWQLGSAVDHHEPKQVPTAEPFPGWVEAFECLVKEAAAMAQSKQISLVQNQISVLNRRIEGLTSSNSLIVPILTFAPAEYEPAKDIRIVVEATEDGFCASLYDANLSMCGETEADAISALKDYIIDVFETLQRLPKLGPAPARQLAVLKRLIKRCE